MDVPRESDAPPLPSPRSGCEPADLPAILCSAPVGASPARVWLGDAGTLRWLLATYAWSTPGDVGVALGWCGAWRGLRGMIGAVLD